MTGTLDPGLFNTPLHIINVGADLFADPLASQGAPANQGCLAARCRQYRCITELAIGR